MRVPPLCNAVLLACAPAERPPVDEGADTPAPDTAASPTDERPDTDAPASGETALPAEPSCDAGPERVWLVTDLACVRIDDGGSPRASTSTPP